MSDTLDWKQKYRDSLIEMQAEEERWRHAERVLRRLVGRLCAAGMGVDPQLDDELSALAAANRRNADAEELARMADSLTSTVVAVDTVAPVASTRRVPVLVPPDTPAGAAQIPAAIVAAPAPAAVTAATVSVPPSLLAIQSAVSALLRRLQATATQAAALESVLDELPRATTAAGLAAVISRVADLVHEHGELMARERLQTAAVLGEVTTRLDEVARYLRDSNSATQTRYDDAQSHNDAVMWQVRELTGEINTAREFGALQTLVTTRLERVAREVCDFRAREEHRMLEYHGRSEQMQARIADLERESKELQAKLHHEKSDARLDPLTGVANRKSFDERFAQDLQRRRRGDSVSAMLLWDIDNFKQINDTYGHRAGDRVLQSVAACFTAAARGTDFVARIGGEEFVLLLSGVLLEEAMQIANRVRGAVEALRFHFRGTPVKVTASCGITELEASDAAEAAFDRADGALYRAKHSGKNLCVAA
jgi:diguanylate cyclase